VKALDRKLRVAAVRDENETVMLGARVPVAQMDWLRRVAAHYGLTLSLVVRLILAEARDNLPEVPK